jgi:hypothetical protein
MITTDGIPGTSGVAVPTKYTSQISSEADGFQRGMNLDRDVLEEMKGKYG